MQFTKLLGTKLKSYEVIELLEVFDVDVIYDFDRLHEGVEDRFWASFYKQGFQFRFDEKQNLDVIFLYMMDISGFLSINASDVDVQIYQSFLEAKEAFDSNNIEYTKSSSDNQINAIHQWIKAKFSDFTVHYEFHDKNLRMITLSLIK